MVNVKEVDRIIKEGLPGVYRAMKILGRKKEMFRCLNYNNYYSLIELFEDKYDMRIEGEYVKKKYFQSIESFTEMINEIEMCKN